MKTPIKNPINRFGVLVLLAAFFWTNGCVTQMPDPLAGWHPSSLNNLHLNKMITDDYQDYIQKLSPRKKEFVGAIDYFEDGTGRHAVDIKTGANGRWWRHVLIYDNANKRINVIAYKTGGYRS
jgi:hypothetical protein